MPEEQPAARRRSPGGIRPSADGGPATGTGGDNGTGTGAAGTSGAFDGEIGFDLSRTELGRHTQPETFSRTAPRVAPIVLMGKRSGSG